MILEIPAPIEPTDDHLVDLFIRLGYEPESWTGLWQLPSNPLVFRGFGIIIFREVAYLPGTIDPMYINGQEKTRLRIRLDPDRW